MYITPFFSLLGRSLIYLISVLVQWLHHWRISKKLSKKYYPFLFSISSVILLHSNLNSPELQKCYFLYNHKQFCSKVPIILYFVRPKHPSGNCYSSCFLTEKTALTKRLFDAYFGKNPLVKWFYKGKKSCQSFYCWRLYNVCTSLLICDFM